MPKEPKGEAPPKTPVEREVSEETKQALTKKISKVREVGTIIRSLNVYPSEDQLRGWIKEMEEDEPTGYVTYEKFFKVAMRVLTSNTYARDDEEKLYRAFLALDAEKKGYLTPDELRGFMTGEGEPFTTEEIDEMLMPLLKHIAPDYVTVLAQ
ncbi:Dynein regulatory complex protein 8 [Borealophlyctis nickersoniae]|nr:Dynein regulatory complex protein 8 [Borealophlyctis nickersoniae]